MTEQEIVQELFSLSEDGYQTFQSHLIPTVAPEAILGVRTPALRDLAKRIRKECGSEAFLSRLPHRYFEENQLHAFLLSEIVDFDRCVTEVSRFLPFVDNWATCDQMSPRVFRRDRAALLPHIERWIASPKTYTVRYGIKMLMDHFLDEDFDPRYLDRVASIRSEEYYVNMMIAWYFATALAKRYEEALPYAEEGRLPDFVRHRTMRKALESYRISEERKRCIRERFSESVR